MRMNSVNSEQKQLEKDEKRIAELDRLFIRLYEDNVASRISDDRFAIMSRAYEDEQRELMEQEMAWPEDHAIPKL